MKWLHMETVYCDNPSEAEEVCRNSVGAEFSDSPTNVVIQKVVECLRWR